MKNNIIVIGPKSTVKGGITTVIDGYKNSQLYNNQEFNIKYYSSCVSGFFIKKIIYAMLKMFFFVFYIFIYKPKIVHIHMSFGGSYKRAKFYLKISRLFKCNVIAHIHGADWDEFYTSASKKMQVKIKSFFNKTYKIIVLSEEWKQRFLEIVDSDKLYVLHNFVSIKENDIKNEIHDGFNITFLGEFCERKGCFNIPHILEKVGNKNFNMFFAGFGDEDTLKEVINNSSVKDRCKIVGYVDYQKKVDLFSKTDVFLFPSKNEGVPMVLLEAMSFGIPCVTTDVGGIPSIINEVYKNGKLYNPSNFEGMAYELNKLMSDNDYYEKISKNARNLSKLYSLDETILKCLNIYRNLKIGE